MYSQADKTISIHAPREGRDSKNTQIPSCVILHYQQIVKKTIDAQLSIDNFDADFTPNTGANLSGHAWALAFRTVSLVAQIIKTS